MALTPALVALSARGEALARRLAAPLGAEVHGLASRTEAPDIALTDAISHLQTLFAAGRPIVGFCAAGILIRATAPLLADKRAEPPVLALAEDGSAVIPLLGGHRGANALARQIGGLLGIAPAITTAGDAALGFALDESPAGWSISNPHAAKPAMAALLAGQGARLTGSDAPLATWLHTLPPGDGPTITASLAPAEGLAFHPQRAALGVGCSRDCPPEELIALVDGLLADTGISPAALAAAFTLDLKGDEPAMAALARHLGRPLRLFDAATLERETPRLANPSDVVFAEVGCHGVAEAAALAGAGPDATLHAPKRKTARATAALALAPAPITTLAGRSRGHLAVVGIGPGRADWRTPEVSRLIAEAEELVGYTLYIDLLGPLAAGKTRADFPLGGEEARCRHALEAAGQGRNVALVCSGDAGIYAMAALVYELLGRGDLSPAARAVEVIVSPGVSALQAAAARIGAPLGHDFCAISLSDLLTPRADILKRLQAAADGDFVISFYNPVSARRRTLLDEAKRILLTKRPADTPVVLASSLGRPEESVRLRRLADLDTDEVDMLTLVMVGSSASRLVATPDGPRLYTPRGYAAKHAKAAE